MLSGSPDAARQILVAIAAAVITVVGVVFSMVIVALTIASAQFGPLMLRNLLLLDQAAMIDRLSLSSVREESDQADIQRAYQAVLRVHAGLAETQTAPRDVDEVKPRRGVSRRGSL